MKINNTKKNIDPLVSVVITTKDEETNIENCLNSIICQNYNNIEIIVVDNYSKDKTIEIAKKYTRKVFSKGPERSAQRNYGMIMKANGIYVIYLDADMLLAPDVIKNCVNYCKDRKYVALHLSEIVLGNSTLSKIRRFEREFYDGTAIDGARFFLKQVFCKVGGFDENLFKEGSGEDWDIDKLIRQEGEISLLPKYYNKHIKADWPLSDFVKQKGVLYIPGFSGLYHNEENVNFFSYLKKKFYYTKGFNAYINKWGKKDKDIRKQFGFLYRYFIVFFEDKKWKKVLKSPFLFLGVFFLRFCVGLVFIYSKLRTLSANKK